MNLAIVHFHLNPGGVTRVVENHLAALDAVTDRPIRIALIYGGRRSGLPDDFATRFSSLTVSLHAVDGLDYDDQTAVDPAALEAALRKTLAGQRFRPGATLLHVHNHALGKNLALPHVLASLATDWPLLLQIHDFAEDFRPTNYGRLRSAYGNVPGNVLYPQASQIHYAVLNGRDHDVLAAAGVAADRLHQLPNPVLPPAIGVDRPTARRRVEDRLNIAGGQSYVFYPVRGIRRKNLGEALLLTMLGEPTEVRPVIGIARAPLNPSERPIYDRWSQLAANLGLPVRFGVAEIDAGGVSFEDNLAAADIATTTSIAEGFGMAFLEPWLAGLPLIGRNLPSITKEFLEAGVRLDGSYERLAIPLDWVGRDLFASTFLQSAHAALSACDYPMPDDWSTIVDRKIVDETIDFADLDERLQERVLMRVTADPAALRELRTLNRHVLRLPSVATIERNGESIRRSYGREPIGRLLLDVYDRLIEAPFERVQRLAEPRRILDRFLDLDRFRPIRSSMPAMLPLHPVE